MTCPCHASCYHVRIDDKPHYLLCSPHVEGLKFQSHGTGLDGNAVISSGRLIFMSPEWLSKPAVVWSLSNFSSLSHCFIFFWQNWVCVFFFFLPVRKRSTGSTAPLRILCFFLRPPSPSGRMASWRWPQEGWGRKQKQINYNGRERLKVTLAHRGEQSKCDQDPVLQTKWRLVWRPQSGM